MSKLTSDRVIQFTYDAIDESKLAHYAIGHQWALTSETTAATLLNRVHRWRRGGMPEAISHWIELMSVLGYDVVLKKRD